MIQKAFSMTVKPGFQDEYERRHKPIWPELRKVLKEHGVSQYSIYLNRGTGQLFAYVEVESQASWQQIAETEGVQRNRCDDCKRRTSLRHGLQGRNALACTPKEHSLCGE